MTKKRLIRMQDKGQVTLPADVRRKLGLKRGDLVAVRGTKDGVLITSAEVPGTKALKHMGDILKERGLTLEELIESGRKDRSDVLEER